MTQDSRKFALRLAGVGKIYRRGEREIQAVRQVTFDVERGEIAAVAGPSGSGKSALLRIIGCQEAPDNGRIIVMGRDVVGLESFELAEIRNREIGFIPQNSDLIGKLSIIENAIIPLKIRDISESAARKKAREMLALFGLDRRADDKAVGLSVSEQAFVMLVRALINDPRLLVVDDVTGRLNESAGAKIVDTINDARAERGITVVDATADQRLLSIADRIIVMRDGAVERVLSREEFRIRSPSIS